MLLPTRRLRVAVAKFGIARTAADLVQSRPGAGPAPEREDASRAAVERSHPPRVFRLEGAGWCEVTATKPKAD